jgi:hypothetical protein
MRIRKYDFDFGRRELLAKTGQLVGAGLLAPLWPLIAKGGDISKAFPDELMSIDAYTKGAIKTGDMVTADNVDHLKTLLTPIQYMQVKQMGRRFRIVPTTTDASKLFPHAYLDATIRNTGRGKLDEVGNVWTVDGQKWVGGLPFPDPKTALEAFSNLTLSWGRHDNAVYAIQDHDLDEYGNVNYAYEFTWIEEQVACRLGGIGPYAGPEHQDKLRYQTVLFTGPDDIKGQTYLNTWYYDQRRYPDLVGYVPAFKRVRKFPTNQRFEPLVAGMTLYLSDAWAAGDPSLTWGNYRMIGRTSMLAAVTDNWHGDLDNWIAPTHGGQKGQTFFEYNMQMVPEAIIVEAEPTGYPRAPVGKKRVWLDTRNLQVVGYETYDRRGASLKSFEPSWSQHIKGDLVENENDGTPVWTWSQVMSHDVQSNRMTRFTQAKEIDGIRSSRNTDGLYERYLTPQAIGRLGT